MLKSVGTRGQGDADGGHPEEKMIRASDAKEEGVGNPQKKRPDTRIKIRPHIITKINYRFD